MMSEEIYGLSLVVQRDEHKSLWQVQATGERHGLLKVAAAAAPDANCVEGFAAVFNALLLHAEPIVSRAYGQTVRAGEYTRGTGERFGA